MDAPVGISGFRDRMYRVSVERVVLKRAASAYILHVLYSISTVRLLGGTDAGNRVCVGSWCIVMWGNGLRGGGWFVYGRTAYCCGTGMGKL